jgi:O-antigen ligase
MLAVAGWSLKSGDVGQAIVMGGVITGTVFALALVWRRPDFVIYGLFAMAVAVESEPLGSGLSLTDQVPAFHPLQTLLPLPGLVLNPVEAMALLCLGVIMIKSKVRPDARVVTGPLWKPFLVLMGLLFIAVFRGALAGGDVKIALWSVRGMILMFIAYILTVSLIRRPDQLRPFFLILVGGVMVKGLIGIWRFLIDFHAHISVEVDTGLPGNSLMAHEESFFFLLALFLAILAFAYDFPKRDRHLSLLAFGLTILPMIANQRRVAIAALVIAMLLLVLVTYVLEPHRRRAIVSTLLLLALVLPVYGFATWNTSSLIAMPTQAIKSQFAPDQRDASSDQYRDIENVNLRATAKQSPLLGIGFGLPMTQAQILPNIRSSYSWYLYLPHNGLLWLGMTMGLLGLTVFSWLMAHVILKTVAAIKATADNPHLRALFILSLLAVAMYMTFGLYDQGLLSQRISLFMGVQFGLLALIPRLAGPRHDPSPGNWKLLEEVRSADLR